MKTLSAIVVFLLISAYVLWPGQKKSIPFSKEAIQADLHYHAEWTMRDLSAEEEDQIRDALSQTYRYLGSGGQCYAFVSSDDQYVVKFFKQKCFTPSTLASFIERKVKKREHIREQVFQAFKFCFDQLNQETGMLYVHLNPTSHLQRTLTVSDALGLEHHLPLDALEFAIQKKAELAFDRIDTLMRANDREGAKKAIDLLLELNASLLKRGYRNRDPNVRSNCGFVGEQAIWVDVGRIVKSEKIDMAKEFAKIAPRFRQYLMQKHPILLEHFDKRIEELQAL